MSFSTQDIELLRRAKQEGKTKEQALATLAQTRQTVPAPAEEATSKPFANKVTDFLGLGGATQTFGNLLARQGIGTDTPKEVTQQFIDKPTKGAGGWCGTTNRCYTCRIRINWRCQCGWSSGYGCWYWLCV